MLDMMPMAYHARNRMSILGLSYTENQNDSLDSLFKVKYSPMASLVFQQYAPGPILMKVDSGGNFKKNVNHW